MTGQVPSNHRRGLFGSSVPTNKARSRTRRVNLEALESRTLLTYSPPTGFLTGPQVGAPFDLAINYLRNNGAEYGITGADVDRLIVSDMVPDNVSGATLIYLRQGFNGIRVDNQQININVSKFGEIINVGGRFWTPLGSLPSAAQPPVPVLSASQAIVAAASAAGINVQQPPTFVRADGGTDSSAVFSASFARNQIPARLEYFAMADGSARLSWQLDIDVIGQDHWWDFNIDATTNQVLRQVDWVNHLDGSSYNVFQLPTMDPLDADRVVVTNPADPVASPFGWHDTNGATGAESTLTKGNNVNAYEDTGNNNAPGFQPDGGPNLTFNFSLDLTQAPSAYQSASITNLFYVVNTMHDTLYQYGFDEVAGNFQVNNYGKGGLGGDPVNAEAQDGSGTNNANFATPPDGQSGRMQMYIGTLMTPNHDGSLDNTVVAHEFGHGWSIRLTGGPGDAGSLSAWQSAGMGEGYGDFLGLWFTTKDTDTPGTPRKIADYLLPVDDGGVRRFPYSYDMSLSPITASNYNALPPDTAYYNIGELWCAALYDMMWNLVERYGFDTDFIGGAGGNNIAMQLVTTGMKLQPSNPTVREARDAILQADQLLYNGANQAAIWQAFARRGMGLNFVAGNNTDVDFPNPDFTEPVFVKAVYIAPAGVRENQVANVTIGQIDDAAGVNSPSDYEVTIDWGDGTSPTVGTVVMVNPNLFNIVGSHNYQEGGQYPVGIFVSKTGGRGQATANGVASVRDLEIQAASVPLSVAKEGDQFSGLVGTFFDTDPDLLPPESYSVTIQWGDDGTQSPGTVEADPLAGPNHFKVNASHVFGGGTSAVVVSIVGPGLGTANAQTQVNVPDSPLHSNGLNTTPPEGKPSNAPVAFFTDEDPRNPPASNYFATINWGDGFQTSGIITANPLGPGYYVSGNHPYNWSPTPYQVTVQVGNFTGDEKTSATAFATVQDAALTGSGFTYSGNAGQAITKFFGVFSDADPRNNPVSHYQATINWGDGEQSQGEIVVNSDGGYLVKATHAYRVAQTYDYTITVGNAPAPSTVVLTGKVTVAPSPLAVEIITTAAPIETQPFAGVIARITTPNTIADPQDFQATINWGDNTISTDAVIERDPSGTGFLVRSLSKVYADPGSYDITVIVTTAGAQSGAAGSINVADAPLTSTGTTLPTVPSKTLISNIVVATFSDADISPNIGDFSALITWGDGTAATPGTIEPTGSGDFRVIGSHAFAKPGQYPFSVKILSRQGSTTTAIGNASVTARLFPITGALSSANGAGAEQGVTKSANPIFAGTAEPGATVTVFATQSGQAQQAIATAIADAAGNWTATSSTLVDGSYAVAASSVDSFGITSSPLTPILPAVQSGPLIVDSTGPVVQRVQVQPRNGSVQVVLADAGSGLLQSALQNTGNYSLIVVGARSQKVLRASGVTTTGSSATLTFVGLPKLGSGSYVIQISSPGITDVAGNILDERYFVPFPGIYTRSGQNYVAQFDSNGTTVSPLRQYIPPPEIEAAKRFRRTVKGRIRVAARRGV